LKILLLWISYLNSLPYYLPNKNKRNKVFYKFLILKIIYILNLLFHWTVSSFTKDLAFYMAAIEVSRLFLDWVVENFKISVVGALINIFYF
jgi:hypothetical protein